jgi:hypothetical protein
MSEIPRPRAHADGTIPDIKKEYPLTRDGHYFPDIENYSEDLALRRMVTYLKDFMASIPDTALEYMGSYSLKVGPFSIQINFREAEDVAIDELVLFKISDERDPRNIENIIGFSVSQDGSLKYYIEPAPLVELDSADTLFIIQSLEHMLQGLVRSHKPGLSTYIDKSQEQETKTMSYEQLVEKIEDMIKGHWNRAIDIDRPDTMIGASRFITFLGIDSNETTSTMKISIQTTLFELNIIKTTEGTVITITVQKESKSQIFQSSPLVSSDSEQQDIIRSYLIMFLTALDGHWQAYLGLNAISHIMSRHTASDQ